MNAADSPGCQPVTQGLTWVTGQPWPMCPHCEGSLSQSILDTGQPSYSCTWCADPRTVALVAQMRSERSKTSVAGRELHLIASGAYNEEGAKRSAKDALVEMDEEPIVIELHEPKS